MSCQNCNISFYFKFVFKFEHNNKFWIQKETICLFSSSFCLKFAHEACEMFFHFNTREHIKIKDFVLFSGKKFDFTISKKKLKKNLQNRLDCAAHNESWNVVSAWVCIQMYVCVCEMIYRNFNSRLKFLEFDSRSIFQQRVACLFSALFMWCAYW